MAPFAAPAFAEAGYAVVPDVLSEADPDRLLDELGHVARTRAGARGLMRLPSVAALANATGLLSLASEALGANAVPFKATLFDKSRGANWAVPWHQDTALPLEGKRDAPGWGPFSTKAGVLHGNAPAWALERVVALRFHLDASGPDNGPLRVIAGSHRPGPAERARDRGSGARRDAGRVSRPAWRSPAHAPVDPPFVSEGRSSRASRGACFTSSTRVDSCWRRI